MVKMISKRSAVYIKRDNKAKSNTEFPENDYCATIRCIIIQSQSMHIISKHISFIRSSIAYTLDVDSIHILKQQTNKTKRNSSAMTSFDGKATKFPLAKVMDTTTCSSIGVANFCGVCNSCIDVTNRRILLLWLFVY